jgi:hypothetical protein
MRIRRRRPHLAASFEELLERAYGAPDPLALRPASAAELLLERYYGHEPSRRRTGDHASRCTLHVGCDDASHVLRQPRPGRVAILPPAPRLPPTPDAPPSARMMPAVAPSVAFPVAPPVSRAVTPLAPTAEPSAPLAEPLPRPSSPPMPVAAQPLPGGEPASPLAETSVASSLVSRQQTLGKDIAASDDDFIADMKSILEGSGAYDKDRKRVVPRGQEQARAAPYNGVGDGGDGQRIFDRIAKSMRHAGAYDLGDVELENRFTDFDRIEDLKGRVKRPGRKPRSARRAESAASPGAPTVDSKDFIEDLEAIQKQSVGTAEAMRDEAIRIANAMKPELSNPASIPAGYSAPLYNTGEHARTAGDLFQDQILVGKPPGVLFSYGDLVTMADLFESAQQLTEEDAGLLTVIKGLIREEVAGGSVSTERWMKATRDRYLPLAERNFRHFSPNLFFESRKLSRSLLDHNHKQTWEEHHQRAITAARSAPVDLSRTKTSQANNWPLVINAFGDHFLTDAFAAGHVVNKQEIAELFKSRFFANGKLNAEGAGFFDKVAKEAWHGKVAEKFTALETFEPHDAWWNIVDWNPNINSASRFATVLKGVAEKAPDKVANLAVKAVHDHYNKVGLEVVNDAGQGPWKLTGDSHMTEETRRIIETAVRESAAHITDSAIIAGASMPFADCFQRVWKYVPRLTPESTRTLQLFVQGFIAPGHPVLVGKAAALINEEVDTLIQQLIAAHALKPA